MEMVVSREVVSSAVVVEMVTLEAYARAVGV
jgi:hypothetical protein